MDSAILEYHRFGAVSCSAGRRRQIVVGSSYHSSLVVCFIVMCSFWIFVFLSVFVQEHWSFVVLFRLQNGVSFLMCTWISVR